MNKAKLNAERFLNENTEFHLGFLPTEQSHPKTRGLAEALRKDICAGARMMQSVDEDIASAAVELFSGEPFAKLTTALWKAMCNGKRICFSGCGATGRLSILLEAAWRRF